jgi:uncharacterized membrane protein
LVLNLRSEDGGGIRCILLVVIVAVVIIIIVVIVVELCVWDRRDGNASDIDRTNTA